MTDIENPSTNPDAKTVDLAELTRRLGEPEHRQQLVADFADSQGPWTEYEASVIIGIWTYTDPETGIYTDPATERPETD